ncbi:glycosyltransferase family 2 protein [Sulfurimonas sp. HSL-1716]|uniref:glycosyltransferase family 2 protein n=1 Tax=Hydrocurvibacter sulfurireducens TaxID=3131937 RepID=UPI0031F7CDC3
MQLSIVTTLYKSSFYINEFYERITQEARKITNDYEIIFVDDGSPDDSLQKAINLHQKDSKVKVIELSRNFGHHKAIMTGLSHTEGDYVFLIDSDLEEEPELLAKFWSEMQNSQDIDVVYGVQAQRKGHWFEKLSGTIFWKIVDALSSIQIPSNILTARLMNKKYVKSLILYNESEVFLGGILADTGYNQLGVKVKKGSHSKTTYTFKKKVSLLTNSITSFSSKPLVYIFYFGFFITLVSAIFILKLIYNKLVLNIAFQGWTSLIISIWFFGGLIILVLGIMGIYLSKVFKEVKNRPYTIIKNIYEQENSHEL